MFGEGLQKLRTVDRHRVQQRVRHQNEPERQPPAPEQGHFAMHTGGRQRQQRGAERQENQRMALGAVPRHVEDGVAMVDEGIEVWQRTAHCPPKGCLPDRRAPAHDCDTDSGTECDLGERIHALKLNRCTASSSGPVAGQPRDRRGFALDLIDAGAQHRR